MVYVVLVCNAVKVKSYLGRDGDQRQFHGRRRRVVMGRREGCILKSGCSRLDSAVVTLSLWWSAESVGPNSRWAREDGSGEWW
jgi:hypothetical protein